MPETATPLTDKINALASYANEVTGKNENLSDAVRTLCEGYMPNGITLDQMATRSIPVINNPTINAEMIRSYTFEDCTSLVGVLNMPNVTELGAYVFQRCSGITEVHAPKLVTVGTGALALHKSGTQEAHIYLDSLKVFPNSFIASKSGRIFVYAPCVEEFEGMCFNSAYGYLRANNGFVIVPDTVKKVGTDLTRNTWTECIGYKFYGKPNEIHSDMVGTSRNSVFDIYVPWSEGEVGGAPWGGTRATIHYNTVYNENGEIVSST